MSVISHSLRQLTLMPLIAQTWKQGVSHANKTFLEYALRCASGGVNGCDFSDYGDFDSETLGNYLRINMGVRSLCLSYL